MCVCMYVYVCVCMRMDESACLCMDTSFFLSDSPDFLGLWRIVAVMFLSAAVMVMLSPSPASTACLLCTCL